MAEIQQSSSDDAAMPDASQSPSQTPPPLSSPHHNVVPIAVSQSHSQDSQPPATPINEYETLYTLFRTCDRSPPTDSEGFNLDIVNYISLPRSSSHSTPSIIVVVPGHTPTTNTTSYTSSS